MPPSTRRRDPYWELEGQNVRRTRTARRVVGTLVVGLSCVILALVLARLPTVDAREVLFGSGRPLVFVAAGADLLACCLVIVRELRHPLAG